MSISRPINGSFSTTMPWWVALQKQTTEPKHIRLIVSVGVHVNYVYKIIIQ